MNWYKDCLEFHLTEGPGKIDTEKIFDEKIAKNSLIELYKIYSKEKFSPSENGEVKIKLKDISKVIEENKTNQYYDAWVIWRHYFIWLGRESWDKLWLAVKEMEENTKI